MDQPPDPSRQLQHLRSHPFIGVLRVDRAEDAVRAGRALLAAGLRFVEVTLTVPRALEAIATLRAEAPPEAAIGAGTVLSARDLDEAIAAGATFAISPDVHPEVIARAAERGILHAPGAMTPTEILTARRAGAPLVKVFPIASVGGASHIRALRGPIPDVPLLVTGGVDLDNLEEFFSAGATAVGLTTTLVLPAAVESGDWRRITDLAHEYLRRLDKLDLPH